MFLRRNDLLRKCLLVALAVSGAFSGARAQSRTRISQAPAVPVAVQPAADYVLHVNDSLDIQFPFSSEYNEVVTVQPDGRIGLREAAAIQIAGKSVAEAQQLIIEAYKGTLKDPTVNILLKNFLAPSFYVSGEVGRPGRYDLRQNTTLIQALSEAGGMLNERAKKTQVVIFRPQPSGTTYESHVIDVKDLLRPKDGSIEDYPIRPGDIISVPQNRYSKIQRYIPTANLGAYATPF